MALDEDGYFEVVVAPVCPVDGFESCLRTGRTASGGVSYRNLLAREDFYDDRGPDECPNDDSIFCGPYRPEAVYVQRHCPTSSP